jgi:hypothetical protein
VQADHREREERLGDEVAIRHGVEAVLEARREVQVVGHAVRVERDGRAGQRARAQRRDIGPCPGVEQAVDVAGQGPTVGEEVVGQGHRLGTLQVGVARQVGVTGVDGAVEEHLLERQHVLGDLQERALRVAAQVGGDLVVPAAAGVELRGGRGQLGGAALHGGVDVLVGRQERERALGQLLLDLVQGGQHLDPLGVGEDADAGQPTHVRPGPGDVVGREALVEGQAHREGEQVVGGPTIEATMPESCHHPCPRCPWVPAQVSTDSPHSRTKPAESSWRKLSSAS